MQVLIDIDENVFTRLFDNGMEDYEIVNDDLFAIAKSIRNCTPLDEIRSLCCEHEIANSAFDGTPIIAIGKTSDGDTIWEDLFNYIQTIIEADTKESEE